MWTKQTTTQPPSQSQPSNSEVDNARDRVEIKRDGEVIGDIQTARISIEDGAIFKGRIEIGQPEPKKVAKPENSTVPMGAGAA